MINDCISYGLPEPEYNYQAGFFSISFRKKLNDELNDGQKKVFNFIKKNKGKMAKNISEQLNMPFGTVDRHIRVLLKMKLIERKGSKKTGGYYIK